MSAHRTDEAAPATIPRVSERPLARDVPEPGSLLFVSIVGLTLWLMAMALVRVNGPRVPIWDDFDVVPVMAGEQPMTLGWLWSQHNEHRIFLPRLILLAAFGLTGNDFRAGMVINVCLFAGLAAAVVLVLRRVRGHARYSDALYPLMLLHLGHQENLLWNMSISYILPVTLVGLVMASILIRPEAPSVGRALGIGLLLAMMPLTNAGGVAMTLAPALWMLSAGVARLWKPGRESKRGAWAMIVASIPAIVLTGLYFHNYERATQVPRPPGPWAVVRTTLQFLGTSLGPAGIDMGLASGWIVLAVVLLGGLALLRRAVVEPSDRARSIGLLSLGLAVMMLAVGTGWGRAGMGPMAGAQLRYIAMAVPTLLFGAIAWEIAGPGFLKRFVPMALLTMFCVLLWPNTRAGLEGGATLKARERAFFEDLNLGIPRFLLVRQYTPFLQPTHEGVAEGLRLLQAARIAPFDRMVPDPEFQEIPVDLEPYSVQMGQWDGRTMEANGPDPYLMFDLPQQRLVAGVRLRYSHRNPEREPARFKLAWKRTDQEKFLAEQEYAVWALPTGDNQETLIWIGDRVDQLRIQPDNRPCTFRIDELTLLVPREGLAVSRPNPAPTDTPIE